MPLKLAQQLLGTERVETISVALSDVDAWRAFAEAAHHLPQLEAVPFDELDEVYYKHAVDWLDAQFGFIRSIILLVVFLAIFNVVSMTVMERTQEIATLRANGESRLKIAAGTISGVPGVGFVGGFWGVVAGWACLVGLLPKGIAIPPPPGSTPGLGFLVELP